MANNFVANTNPDQPLFYEIRIRGHLGFQPLNRFEGLVVTLEENGDTLLTGPVVDQAALYGLLRKVRDLGLPLLAVTAVETRSIDVSEDEQVIEDNATSK